jgi:hypothetical protein
LGFDDEMAQDHHWGPRMLLFLADEDHLRCAEALRRALSPELPAEIDGYSTSFSAADSDGVRHLEDSATGSVNHLVEIHTLLGFSAEYLGFDPLGRVEPADWLSTSEQRLRTVVEGPVYHDEVGLREMREALRYYPRDLWLYQMAAVWTRIGQDEHLMGRAGAVGDELGSALIASRLVRDIMRLRFMMKGRYAPYAKWLGTAFSGLRCADAFRSLLEEVVHAASWQVREERLVRACQLLAEAHNALSLTEGPCPRVWSASMDAPSGSSPPMGMPGPSWTRFGTRPSGSWPFVRSSVESTSSATART